MEQDIDTYDKLRIAYDELQMQLEEANNSLQAIRTGQVDAFVVYGAGGHQLYTLKTADQTYRVFIEKMNEGAVTLNRSGLILYCNSRFAEMMDARLERVLGLPFENFVTAGSKHNYLQVIENGWTEDTKAEITLVTSLGIEVPCLLSCNTLELDEGTALSLILTDLTVQKRNEQILQAKNEELATAQNATAQLNDELENIVAQRTSDLSISREHLKLLANNIPQMTWTNLPDGTFNFYNQQWYNYTRLDFERSKGQQWQQAIHPDDLAVTNERLNDALKTGNIYEVENRYRNGDGVYRWHLNRAVPLRNEAGEIVFWVGTATDIEDQKQQMQRKDEFIGIASHELKTPLTSLKGYLQIIADYKKEEVPVLVKNYVGKANIAINKLQHLVNDLLDVSKIQAGRLEYLLGPIDLTELIDNVAESATHIYPKHYFEKLVPGHYQVSGSAERLEQVLMNFINNAVKYSPASKNVAIATSMHQNVVRVAVTDRGVGLSKEQISKIFDRFYRVEDKKFMTSGLGMGLYISTEIINFHNGKIGVESEPGKGSTFFFELPLILG